MVILKPDILKEETLEESSTTTTLIIAHIVSNIGKSECGCYDNDEEDQDIAENMAYAFPVV